MRSEAEMLALILKVAEDDSRIRAVCMNGSRVNSNVKKDVFQDYDIVYLVTDMEAFTCDKKWVDVFGERLIMQTPEDMSLYPPELGGRFTYLMQFMDGNRIDLMLIPVEEAGVYITEDTLTMILLDKDHRFTEITMPTDEGYWVSRPSEAFFADCCNEFWWLSLYVAKGLRRSEIVYAQKHLQLMREMLLKMMAWQIGSKQNFSVNVGKSGKFMEQYVTEANWSRLLKTYVTGDDKEVWDGLFVMCKLFEETMMDVGARLGFTYDKTEVKQVVVYLEQLYQAK